MKPKTPQLFDIEKRNAECPDTFEIPDGDERRNLQPDTYVKLHFKTGDRKFEGERMWVLVQEQLPDGSYVGELNNEPVYTPNLNNGDLVAFEAKHVATTMAKPSPV